ncbi:glycosyltransferase [Sphingobacterium daejeonense]|uniref:glycosyltransferase n=1 Tax=Sphingobacterium daejeonense TaxID=371142 RepID=UPI0010C28CCF|nr:glycosyltransferase [Sphingobacterium daejeonense]VTQ07336.1 UDP-D-galactose:(glucosyl)lipopolysaccharide-1,6-D-galactosyltransferase [Sphingobacterium daejeonense]
MNNYLIFHQSFSNSAGTERVLYNIAEHLSSSSNNRVRLLLCEKIESLVYGIDGLPIKIDSLNLEAIRSSKIALLSNYLNVFKRLKNYINLLDSSENYTVICSNSFLAAIFYFCSKKFSNIKVISCEHFSMHIAGRFSNFLRQSFYSKIAVVSLTERDKELLQKKFNPKICVCIPNAIPFDLEHYSGENKNTIISIGRYTYQKGFDLYLEALSKLDKKIFDNWKVVIIGDDYGDKNLLKGLIDRYNLDFVHLEPSTENIKNYYKKASFYVMSSRFEGLPMVLLEAMGFGLPIISFDCPTGPAEIVSSKNGVLVRDGDLIELGEAIKLFIENPEIMKEKAVGSEMEAQRFKKSNINKLWDNLFYELWKN